MIELRGFLRKTEEPHVNERVTRRMTLIPIILVYFFDKNFKLFSSQVLPAKDFNSFHLH